MSQVPELQADTDATGGRRYLTVLFADLCESTRLGDLLEAEHYAEMLGAMRALCREIVPRHGGRIARLQGDGMLAIFGYPEAREDDGRRATEAALELHAAVSRIEVDGSVVRAGSLGLHSGIHAGLVFVSDGDVERGRFELLGSVPNTAARLSDRAERGEIVVSEETLGPEAHFFTTGPRQLLSLKGRPAPVAAFRVLGRAPVQRRYEARTLRGLAPFVGRDTVLATLGSQMQATLQGRPQCAAVAGGPGVGKTRLIEELLRRTPVAGFRVLRGYCESYLSAEPLQPFMQMLRSLPEAEAAQGDPGRRGAALLAWLERLAVERPLVLVIDDWQWADDASQQLLDAILALPRPIFVLAALRTGGGDSLASAPVPPIELAPLSLAEAQQAMSHLLPGADPFVVAEIHRHAGGNPLFIEELCHSASAAGAEHPPESLHGSAAWLSALIESRVGRLALAQADIVRAAAVIGNVVPAWLLERLTGYGEHDPLVQSLAAQDLLFPAEQAGTLRFKHGITRDVVYEAVGLHARRAMHRRIVGALTGHAGQVVPEDSYEALAYHAAAGGLHAEAARYAELAGDKAAAARALDRARHQYTAALAALDALRPNTPEAQRHWCAVAGRLGMACVFDHLGLADGVGTFERGLALARRSGDVETIARAEYWLGYLLYAKGRALPARGHCEAALALALQLGDERLAAQVRATLGQVLATACDYAGALPLFEAAIDTKRKQRKPGSSIAVGSAYTLACQGGALGDQGRFDLADECFAEAMHLLGDTVHEVASSVRNWISAVWQWQGRWQEAADIADGSVRIAEQVKSRQLLAMSRVLRGHALWVLHHRAEDLQAIRDGTSWIEARGGGLVTSLNYGFLVDANLALGREAEARRHAARLFLRARQRDRLGEAFGCRALARASAAAGQTDRAAHYLARADTAAAARSSPHEQAGNELCRGELAWRAGRHHEARTRLDHAAEAFESLTMRWHVAQVQELRQRL